MPNETDDDATAEDWALWEMSCPSPPERCHCRASSRCLHIYRNRFTNEVTCGRCNAPRPRTCYCGNESNYVIDGPNGDVICRVCARVNSFVPPKPEPQGSEPYQRRMYVRYLLKLHCGWKHPVNEPTVERVRRELAHRHESAHPKNVRSVIKRLKIRGQVQNASQIACRLGFELPHLDETTIERVESVFLYLETYFKKLSEPRKYFLNYSYVLRRVLQKIGRDDIADVLPEMRTSSRKRVNDQLWESLMQLASIGF
jgi:hypothetical protein